MAIEIVKDAIDIGISTNRLEEHQRFWGTEVGLPFDHVLKVGGGMHQHRYGLHGAVLKCNSHRDPLPPDEPTGFTALAIAADVDPMVLHSPDGTPVALGPARSDGILTSVVVEATDADVTLAALVNGLGAELDGTGSCRIGESRLDVVAAPDRRPTVSRDGLGIRYLTVQVRDVVAAHAHALAHGLGEGLPPVRLGDVACISFVRLPDGDWIELSQRASLTGPLPDLPATPLG